VKHDPPSHSSSLNRFRGPRAARLVVDAASAPRSIKPAFTLRRREGTSLIKDTSLMPSIRRGNRRRQRPGSTETPPCTRAVPFSLAYKTLMKGCSDQASFRVGRATFLWCGGSGSAGRHHGRDLMRADNVSQSGELLVTPSTSSTTPCHEPVGRRGRQGQ
jgi:hypothetical protein